ncbi:MAG: M1 family metallopeptidase, partial [Bacteroidota bacterium]
MMKKVILALHLLFVGIPLVLSQENNDTIPADTKLSGSADKLRGALSPIRTCYDVHYYDLQVRIFPDRRYLQGSNRIHFQVMQPTRALQIDLFKNMEIDSILWSGKSLSFKRKHNAVLVSFPEILKKGDLENIEVYYQGEPKSNLGAHGDSGFHWKKDAEGRHWAGMMVEHTGASLWYPNKDHLSDEPDSVKLAWEVPDTLTVISNGICVETKPLEKGWKRSTWLVSYPIDNYNITFNIGSYKKLLIPYVKDTITHELALYALDYEPDSLVFEYFKKLPEMMAFFEEIYGEFPFWRDDFKVIQAPYRGMEHQTCLATGADLRKPIGAENWSYPYISSFRSVVAHELAHEWWGNAISVSDMADLWIQEGLATYSELLFIEHIHNKKTYNYAANDLERFWKSGSPLVGERDVNDDMFHDNTVYFKGADMLYHLRKRLKDDELFFKFLRTFYQRFKLKTVTTKDFTDTFTEIT